MSQFSEGFLPHISHISHVLKIIFISQITLNTIRLLPSKNWPNGGILTESFLAGSASYNLLVISAVCVVSVPSPTIKRISEYGVFVVTSLWSLFAYVWLLVVRMLFSSQVENKPDKIINLHKVTRFYRQLDFWPS